MMLQDPLMLLFSLTTKAFGGVDEPGLLDEGGELEHPSEIHAPGQSEHPASEVGTPDFHQLFDDEESVDLQEYDMGSEADWELFQSDIPDQSLNGSDAPVPMSDRCSKGFATSMIVTSENKRLKTLFPWEP